MLREKEEEVTRRYVSGFPRQYLLEASPNRKVDQKFEIWRQGRKSWRVERFATVTHVKTWRFSSSTCGEVKGRLPQTDKQQEKGNRPTDHESNNEKRQPRFIEVYRRHTGYCRSTGKIQNIPTALPFPCFRLVCTGRTCITPVITTPHAFWFGHVSFTWVFLPLARFLHVLQVNQVEPVHVMTARESWYFPFLKSRHCFISIKLDIISQIVRFCFDNNQHSMRFHHLIRCPVVFAGTR